MRTTTIDQRDEDREAAFLALMKGTERKDQERQRMTRQRIMIRRRNKERKEDRVRIIPPKL